MRRIGKRGSEKYYIIISLILGIMVLALSLYYIFHEYFTQDTLDWQTCRQSIVLRNAMPEFELGGFSLASAKKFPLKCKNQVITIKTDKIEEAEKEIAEAIVSSWYLLGNGDLTIFPTNGLYEDAVSPCILTARIELDNSVTAKYSGDNKIDLERALSRKFSPSQTYLEYLRRGDVDPFIFLKDWHEGGFWFEKQTSWKMISVDKEKQKSFHFPRYFYPDKGDLFIVYSEPVRLKAFMSTRAIPPFMILIQEDEFNKLNDVWLSYDVSVHDLKICSSMESIPA